MEYINTRIPLLADELKRRIDASNSGMISKDMIIQWVHDYAQTTKTRPVELPYVRPDFEGIKQALQADLYNRDSWRELIQAGVGETLLEWVATIGSYDQLSIQRSFQETFLPTAQLVSSIYESARHLGVHIIRKRPATVPVRLIASGPTAIQIPSMSQFLIDGLGFFNRSNIVIPVGEDGVTVTLFQGEIKIVQLQGQNRPFQIAEIGSEDFSISDEDLAVYNQGHEKYRRVTDGLWHYDGPQFVFYENSTANGNVELWFGNHIFGRQPALNETLNIVYAKTLGDEVDSTKTSQRVSLENLNDVVDDRLRSRRLDAQEAADEEQAMRLYAVSRVSGVTTGPVSPGTGAPEPEFYRRMAPHIYAARNRAVTRKDHYAIGLQYPGIADLYFRGQQELGPKNRNFINSVAVTALKTDGTLLSPQEFAKFEDYMRDKGIDRLNYWQADPQPVPVSIKATVFVKADADFPRTEAYIRYKIMEQFRVRLGILGYSMYKSDLDDILKSQHFGVQVDYAILTEPRADTVITRLQYIRIKDITIDVQYSGRNYSGYLQPTTRT